MANFIFIEDPIVELFGRLSSEDEILDTPMSQGILRVYEYSVKRYALFAKLGVDDKKYREKAIIYKHIQDVLGAILYNQEDDVLFDICKESVFDSIDVEGDE